MSILSILLYRIHLLFHDLLQPIQLFAEVIYFTLEIGGLVEGARYIILIQ